MLPVSERESFVRILFKGGKDVPLKFRERNCIFIHIPKCAGTSLSHSLFDGWAPGHQTLRFYSDVFPDFYRGAFKFSFVRDPLDRAFSAYRYLLGNTHTERDQSARRLVESFDSFDDFVRSWLCPENAMRQIHFVPQWCFITDGVGKVGVDFIGKHENILRDFEYVCKRLGFFSGLEHKNKSAGDGSGGLLNVSKEARRLVYEVYKRDYQLFGYSSCLE